MLCFDDIKVELGCQGYKTTHTIRKIQTEYMKEKIAERKAELEMSGYKPKFLAVDEFAIHKGHRYATIYKIILLKNNF